MIITRIGAKGAWLKVKLWTKKGKAVWELVKLKLPSCYYVFQPFLVVYSHRCLCKRVHFCHSLIFFFSEVVNHGMWKTVFFVCQCFFFPCGQFKKQITKKKLETLLIKNWLTRLYLKILTLVLWLFSVFVKDTQRVNYKMFDQGKWSGLKRRLLKIWLNHSR